MTVVAVAGPEIPAFPAVAEPGMIQPSNGQKSPATGTPPASIRPVADCRPPQKSTENQRFGPGVAYYGYRWYDPSTGRWPSRDPFEEEGGLNVYGFVMNDGVSKIDVAGLFTLNDAKESLKDRGIAPAIARQMASGPRSKIHYRSGRSARYSDTQIFEEWIRLEKNETSWLENLPNCPDEICLDDQEKPVNCNNGQWKELGPAGPYHDGADYCMRSVTYGKSAQQCCYRKYPNRKKLMLVTELEAAGTPDKVAPGSWLKEAYNWAVGAGHQGHDVETYNLSNSLGLVGSRAGDKGTYAEVRPPNQGGGSCYQ